ncbi:MAG: peroxiredoxin-like family protein [Anaerolineales bacterium]|nr:peroxiredoxin-like family protein [Anaerolineales bacterium]
MPCREHAAQLCARQDEFSQLNTRVFIISFGTLPALHKWMNETCASFDVLFDPDRNVYRAYQLERSLLRSWSPRTIWTVAKLLLAGRKWISKQDDSDTSQLGGDFIVDKNGILRLVHPSHDPADRPPVDDLLKVIEKL